MFTFRHIACLLLFCLYGHAQAQWDFDLKDNGQTTDTLQLNLPMVYSEADCELTFTAFKDGNLENVVISNPLGCGQPHLLVIDDFVYPLPDDFTLTVDADSHEVDGLVNLGACERLSLLPITTGLPALLVNAESFKLGSGSNQLFYTRGGITYFQIDTLDDDIFCASGTPFIHPDDLIFRTAFE
ncbi:hypothetical protein ACFODZ_13600 [Marinicella sediminis]|uniref:Uncharacterized protein n=1 Tax=Marinicella sediminis TaxID=1792834 RepID=A0ABV7JIT2_9GAMM|nr:hypothetical protein [Marinicella sediminis]